MQKILKTLFMLAISGVFSAVAAPAEYTVKMANSPIKLDGALNEKAWDSVPFAGGFTTFNGAKAPEKTKFKVLQDKFGLYFAFVAEDKIIKSEKRLNGAVWFDDSIEIFLAPVANFSSDLNIREYFHFIFNPDSSIFNNKSVGGILGDWSSIWQAAARRVPGGWTAEVYLPFFPYSSSEDTSWRFNIGRSHFALDGKKPQHSVWAPAAGYHKPDNFAQLKNIKLDRKFYLPSVSNLSSKEQKICGKIENTGKRKLDLEVNFYQQKALKKQIKKANITAGTFAFPVDIAPGDWEVVSILKDGENIVDFQSKQLTFSDSPVEVKVVAPAYRNTVFPDDKPVFTAEIKFADKLESAKFDLLDNRGKVLQSKVLKSSGKLTFCLKDLAAGTYKITGPRQNITLKIVKTGNYVKLDKQKRCVVNGKLFYPRGFMACQKNSLPILQKYHYNLAHFYILHRQGLPEVLAMLDEAQKHNLMVSLSPFWKNRLPGLKGLKKVKKSEMKKFVDTVKKHPAFFGWYLFDEPRGQAFINELGKYYELLKEWDPKHPVIGVDNSAQNCLGLLKHSDILSLDMYPSPNVKDYLDLSIASVVASCRKVANEKTDGVFWYTPQAFSRESYPSPAHFVRPRGLNIPEIKASVYGSIAAGANGQLAFKIGDPNLPIGSADRNAGIFNSEDMKKGYLEILGNEFKALEQALLGDEFVVKSSGLMRAWHSNDADWILLVNVELKDQTVSVEYPGKLYSFQDERTFTGKVKKIKLKPYEVLWLVSKKSK